MVILVAHRMHSSMKKARSVFVKQLLREMGSFAHVVFLPISIPPTLDLIGKGNLNIYTNL